MACTCNQHSASCGCYQQTNNCTCHTKVACTCNSQLCKVNNTTGVYVPAISKYIEQWSIILKTLLALLTLKEWYRQDIVYKTIKVDPYIQLLTTA